MFSLLLLFFKKYLNDIKNCIREPRRLANPQVFQMLSSCPGYITRDSGLDVLAQVSPYTCVCAPLGVSQPPIKPQGEILETFSHCPSDDRSTWEWL